MKGLLSSAASRAWVGVVAAGVLVVVLVIGLQLIPRLSAGQDVLDTAKPVMTDGAVRGEIAGTKLISQYVELADPLVTKGGAAREVPRLLELIARRTDLSTQRARALLRREAPHTEALLRALPFSGIAREGEALTQLLSSTLNITPEELQGQLARSFPKLFAMLSELPSVTSGWRNVPGIEGLTRFDGATVKTLPAFRDYLRDDLASTVSQEKNRFQALSGSGGIGYIPYMLLVAGVIVIGFGLLHARWSVHHPSGRVAWGAVVAIGVVIMVVVGALQYFPRLHGADTTIERFEPAFDERRVAGTRAGVDLLVQTVSFGDPIVTAEGGAAEEVPELIAFVSEQAGISRDQVRSRLRGAAPRTTALLEAIPLSAVSAEVPHLVAVLSRELGLSGDRLVTTLRGRTPGIAQSILAVGSVTIGWNATPGSRDLTRLDTNTPVRSIPAFAEYLDQDVVPVLESERRHFDKLASTWPPINVLPVLVLAVGALLAIYATAMMFLVTKSPARANKRPARRGANRRRRRPRAARR
ncbi:MAG: hypothetical protein WKF42_05880 [Solirubrobacteraceae bacterium]